MTSLDIEEIIDIDISTGDSHLKCCERDQFFCEAEFHPECVTDNEDEACAICTHILHFVTRCGQMSGKPHRHCPFQRKICE